MRISSGILKGLEVITDTSMQTRPTGIKVRQAVFNSIQSSIMESDFLDLFSGSGAVGIEALSRSAHSSTLVELNPKAFKFLKQNVQKVLDRSPDINIYPVREDVASFLKRARSQSYDIIWADPPYADCLHFIPIFNSFIPSLLKDQSSYFILESSSKDSSTLESSFNNLEHIKTKTYGVCSVSFFKLKTEVESNE